MLAFFQILHFGVYLKVNTDMGAARYPVEIIIWVHYYLAGGADVPGIPSGHYYLGPSACGGGSSRRFSNRGLPSGRYYLGSLLLGWRSVNYILIMKSIRCMLCSVIS